MPYNCSDLIWATTGQKQYRGMTSRINMHFLYSRMILDRILINQWKIAETNYIPSLMIHLWSVLIVSSNSRQIHSEENSWNKLNNWQKNIPVLLIVLFCFCIFVITLPYCSCEYFLTRECVQISRQYLLFVLNTYQLFFLCRHKLKDKVHLIVNVKTNCIYGTTPNILYQ